MKKDNIMVIVENQDGVFLMENTTLVVIIVHGLFVALRVWFHVMPRGDFSLPTKIVTLVQ